MPDARIDNLRRERIGSSLVVHEEAQRQAPFLPIVENHLPVGVAPFDEVLQGDADIAIQSTEDRLAASGIEEVFQPLA